MNEYSYACLQRPPGPGAVPREGLIRCEYDCDYCEYDCDHIGIGHYVWGVAVYNRKLSVNECQYYDMRRCMKGSMIHE